MHAPTDLSLPRRHFLATPLMAMAHRLGSSENGPNARGDAQSATSTRFTHAGFLDLQVNGFAGVDFNEPETTADRIQEAVVALRRSGVTRFLATLISAPLDRFSRCAQTVVAARSTAILGIHMEGPYISPEDGARGAHRREDTSPASIDDFRRRQDAANGTIRLVTVAPEVPGALALIEYLRTSGVLVAMGHTAATPKQIQDGILAGATLSTHLGNGCAQMLPRHPNVIWEQLAADALIASLIIDGHHLPPSTVKAMVRAKTPARVVLVTDATAAAGQPPGDYKLGALMVHVDETGRVAVPGQPYLAGSALSMDRAIGNMVRFAGVSLEEALDMASRRPAAYLNVEPAGTLDLEWESEASILHVRRVSD